MVFLLYIIKDNIVKFNNVYETYKDAEKEKKYIFDYTDVDYSIVELAYINSKEHNTNETLNYNEEDNSIDEEHYNTVIEINKQLIEKINKQKQIIEYMFLYIQHLNIGIFSLCFVGLVGCLYSVYIL